MTLTTSSTGSNACSGPPLSASSLDRRVVEQLVRQVLRDHWSRPLPGFRQAPPAGLINPLVVNVSARHVHVTEQDLQVLFGPGAKLTVLRELYQEGEFASEQTVSLIGPRNRMIPNLRILGPCRSYTQVELAYTDGVYLGIDLPLRLSGDHHDTPGGVLVGPHGALNLKQGVIRAMRHVHMSPADAQHYGVSDGQDMKLRIDGPCGLTFDKVRVRVSDKVKLEVHIDTDEGNACHLASASHMELLK